jgi:Fe2+ or Zn2+ uptake regulation protein
MGKQNVEKIAIEKFFSRKQLEKIDKVIESRMSVDDATKKYQKLFAGTDFIIMDGGTNRDVWRHKKLKGIVFKIACDTYGVEANYREFYVSDIDPKRLTITYSISETGSIVVQEEVGRITTKDQFEKHKKDIRKMLLKLHEKILLVDCQFKNFKNFGIRTLSDGSKVPVVLDYGDTVPFGDYQSLQTEVNFSEEVNVSLRCKSVVDKKKSQDQCKGTLVPNKDFSALVCDKCGDMHTFHDAYRAFVLDKKQGKKSFVDGIDEDLLKSAESEYKQRIDRDVRNYATVKMGEVKIVDNTKCRIDEMKPEYEIVGGYIIPPPPEGLKFGDMRYNKCLNGTISPNVYLEFIGENPEDWHEENFICNSDEDVNPITEDTSDILNIISKRNDAQIYSEDELIDGDCSENRRFRETDEGQNCNEFVSSRNHDVVRGDELSESECNDIIKEYTSATNTERDNESIPYTLTGKDVEIEEYSPDDFAWMTHSEESLSEKDFMAMMETQGKKLPATDIDINLLQILNRDPSYYMKCFNISNQMLGLKLYTAFLEITHDYETSETSTTLISLIAGATRHLQDIVWSAMYKSYKLGKLNRAHLNKVFTEAWTELWSVLTSFVGHGDIQFPDFAQLVRRHVGVSDQELSFLFINYRDAFGITDAVHQSETCIENNKSEDISNQSTIGCVSGEDLRSILSRYEPSEIIDALREMDILDIEEIQEDGEQQMACERDELQDGLVPMTLQELKDRPFVIAWTEPGDDRETIVKVDLYEHIMQNIPNIKSGDTNLLTIAAIDPWNADKDPELYAEWYKSCSSN